MLCACHSLSFLYLTNSSFKTAHFWDTSPIPQIQMMSPSTPHDRDELLLIRREKLSVLVWNCHQLCIIGNVKGVEVGSKTAVLFKYKPPSDLVVISGKVMVI